MVVAAAGVKAAGLMTMMVSVVMVGYTHQPPLNVHGRLNKYPRGVATFEV